MTASQSQPCLSLNHILYILVPACLFAGRARDDALVASLLQCKALHIDCSHWQLCPGHLASSSSGGQCQFVVRVGKHRINYFSCFSFICFLGSQCNTHQKHFGQHHEQDPLHQKRVLISIMRAKNSTEHQLYGSYVSAIQQQS